MKHILEVSLAALLGAALLLADWHTRCVNDCQAVLKKAYDKADSDYANQLLTDQDHDNTCTSPIANGTNYGKCVNDAFNKDCLPLDNGNCRDNSAWTTDYVREITADRSRK